MNKPEYQIEESFQYENITLKCIENPDKKELNPCKNCYLRRKTCWDLEDVTGPCSPEARDDGKNVIFVEFK